MVGSRAGGGDVADGAILKRGSEKDMVLQLAEYPRSVYCDSACAYEIV
jgi:hypothetical protein